MLTYNDILTKSGLSVTQSRTQILELFLKSNGALSHADIERMTGSVFDRVTIYRTLQTFTEKGIIHQIPTTDNSVLYALCRENCEEGHHHDNHVHFICLQCNATTCLADVTVPDVRLPRGFRASQSAMLVWGFCENCKQE